MVAGEAGLERVTASSSPACAELTLAVLGSAAEQCAGCVHHRTKKTHYKEEEVEGKCTKWWHRQSQVWKESVSMLGS